MSKARLRRWELGALVAVLLIAAALRLVALDDVPPGLRYDELQNRRMAGRILAGERPLYFAESWGHEPLFHYAQAIAIMLARDCIWSLRLPAPLCGLFGVLTTWLVARRLWDARVAILAATALAISFWSIFYSRVALRLIALTPLSCLAVYFCWRGIERLPEQRRWATVDLIVGGLCLGGTFYIYMAARALLLLPLGFALYLALWHRSCLKRAWRGLLLFTAVVVLTVAPLFLWLHRHPDLERRTEQLADNLAALKRGNLQPVFHQTILALGMFVWHRCLSGQDSLRDAGRVPRLRVAGRDHRGRLVARRRARGLASLSGSSDPGGGAVAPMGCRGRADRHYLSRGLCQRAAQGASQPVARSPSLVRTQQHGRQPG